MEIQEAQYYKVVLRARNKEILINLLGYTEEEVDQLTKSGVISQ